MSGLHLAQICRCIVLTGCFIESVEWCRIEMCSFGLLRLEFGEDVDHSILRLAVVVLRVTSKM